MVRVRYTRCQRAGRSRLSRQFSVEWCIVEAIRGKEIRGQEVWYLVKWHGYSENDNTWEPLICLGHAKPLVEEYELLHQPSGELGIHK